MKKGILLLGLAYLVLLSPQSARAQQGRSMIDEMQQRLEQLQQRMMQGFQGFDSGRDSSGFFFQFDTTFEGGGSTHYFRFTPPGDSSLRGAASGLEDLFRGMFDFGPSDGSAAQSFPRDDGNAPHPDDELLPEERLRLQEEQSAGDPATQPAPKAPAPVKKKPRVESFRI